VILWQRARAVAAEPEVTSYPLLSPLRRVIPPEHFLTTLEPLRAEIRRIVESQPLRAAIYVEFLNTGANIIINQDARFWPVSLAKLPVAIGTMRAVELGRLTLDTPIDLLDAERARASSELYRGLVGSTLPVRDLLRNLLTQSDNASFLALSRQMGTDLVLDMKAALGLDQLFDEEGRITAREYTRFLRALYTSGFLHESNSQYILDLLNQSAFPYFLRQSVPDSISFPHKWGAYPELNAYGDAGIVYVPGRPYMITVLVEGSGNADDRERVITLMRDISSAAYGFFSGGSGH
jgi:beta-lactamase class A